MYSTSKRILAIILLCSHLLTITSCNSNPNMPSQQEITHRHEKLAKKPTRAVVSAPLPSGLDDKKEASSDPAVTNELQIAKSTIETLSVQPTSLEEFAPITKDKAILLRHTTPILDKQAETLPSDGRTTGQQPIDSKRLTSLDKSKALISYKEQTQGKVKQGEESGRLKPIVNTNDSDQTIIAQSFVAKGGHQIQFIEQEGRLVALVKENTLVGFYRKLALPVCLAPGFTIQALSQYSPEWHKAHIAVIFPGEKGRKKGYVYIGGPGLRGGGNSGSSERKNQNKQAGCSYSEDQRIPDPDNPGKWVCPGLGKHPRKPPVSSRPSTSSSRNYFNFHYREESLSEFSRRVEEQEKERERERERAYREKAEAWKESYYDSINTIKREISTQADNILHTCSPYYSSSKDSGVSTTLEKIRIVEGFGRKVRTAIDKIKELEERLQSLGVYIGEEIEWHGIYGMFGRRVSDHTKELWKIVDQMDELLDELRVFSNPCKVTYDTKQQIIDQSDEIIDKLYITASKHLYDQSGRSLLLLAPDSHAHKIARIQSFQKDIQEAIKKEEKETSDNHTQELQETYDKMEAIVQELKQDQRKKEIPLRNREFIKANMIEEIHQALEEPLNKINQLTQQNTLAEAIIEQAYDMRRKLYAFIQSVKSYSPSKEQKELLIYLERLDEDFKQRIKEEKHKIFLKNIEETIQTERVKLAQLIREEQDIKVILEGAHRCKNRIKLMRGRLKDCKFKPDEVLKVIADGIGEVYQTINEQKVKAIEKAASQEEKLIVSVEMEMVEAKIEIRERKTELEKYQAALEKYQKIKIARKESVIEARKKVKQAKEILEDCHKEDRDMRTISGWEERVLSEKWLLKHAKLGLFTIESLIEDYAQKLKEAAQKLKEVQEEEQEMLHQQKAVEEAYRAKAEEAKKKQQEEERVRKKVAERAKELEEKYPPSPGLRDTINGTAYYLQALELGLLRLLTPAAQKARGQQLLKQMAALKAEEEASHKRIQAAYQSDNSPEGNQLIEEELAAKEAQLEKIQELKGQLLAALDFTIEELKDCGIARDRSKGLVQSVRNITLLGTEDLPTIEQLETELTKYLGIYEKDAAFKQLLESYEIAVTKLEVAPNNASLQANKVAIEAKLQAHGLYQGGVELLMLATDLRQAAEDEAYHHFINGLSQEVPGTSSSKDLDIASQQSAKAKQLRDNIIILLRKIFRCPNTPEAGRMMASAAKGAAKSLEDTGRGLLVIASLPILLGKLGYDSVESIVKWEDKLGIKDKYISAKKAIKVLFEQTKYSWENPEEYRKRQQVVDRYKRQMLLYNRAFNAERYHCGQAEELGYITMEALQFFFGDEVVKVVGKPLKGRKVAEGVKVGEDTIQGLKATEVGTNLEKGVQELREGIKLAEGIAIAEAAKGGSEALSTLKPTHYLTRSKIEMQALINDIRSNGIKDAIEYVEFSGQKYIVGGNHRYFAAQKLGIQNVPVKQVQLPFAGYKTPADLMLEGKMPGYWKYIK